VYDTDADEQDMRYDYARKGNVTRKKVRVCVCVCGSRLRGG
jgi:hypothetical protein